MWLQNKFFQRIHNKSGASLVFVLAVMLLLMQVGVSALLAASAGAGAGINERVGNQMNMYADSVQKSVMYSLQTSSSDEKKSIDSAVTLGGQLLGEIYKRAPLSSSGSVKIEPFHVNIDKISITPEFSDGPDLSVVVVRIKIMPGTVTITDSYPKTAAVSAKVTVTATVRNKRRTIMAVAAYDFSRGYLLETTAAGTEDFAGNMLVEKAGEWRLLSYENIDV